MLTALAPRPLLAPEGGPHVPTPVAEHIFDIPTPFGPLPVTNSIFTAWIVMAILVLFAFFSTRSMRLVPSGLQNFWELVVELWVGMVDQTMGRKGRKFVPLIGTAFLFIVFSNWFGINPLIGNLLIEDPHQKMVPLLRSANSDLNVTAAMAIIVIVVSEVMEFRSLGFLGYFKGLLVPNFLRWLEILTRPLSLGFRLFGNIFAGEVLVATMLGLAPFALFPFLGLEVFVGLIQGLIFAMLTLVFLTLATAHAHDHEEHAGAHAPAHAEAHEPSR